MVCQCLSCPEEPKTGGPIPDAVSKFLNRGERSLPWTCWLHSFQSMRLHFFAVKAQCSTLGSSTRNPRSFLQSCFLASQPHLYSCWSFSIPDGGLPLYLPLLNFTCFIPAHFSSLHSECDSESTIPKKNVCRQRHLTTAVVSTTTTSLSPTNAAPCTTHSEGQALKLGRLDCPLNFSEVSNYLVGESEMPR